MLIGSHRKSFIFNEGNTYKEIEKRILKFLKKKLII